MSKAALRSRRVRIEIDPESGAVRRSFKTRRRAKGESRGNTGGKKDRSQQSVLLKNKNNRYKKMMKEDTAN